MRLEVKKAVGKDGDIFIIFDEDRPLACLSHDDLLKLKDDIEHTLQPRIEHIQEVIAELCQISWQAGKALKHQFASDCFCKPFSENRMFSFSFDEPVLNFIKEAIELKKAQLEHLESLQEKESDDV